MSDLHSHVFAVGFLDQDLLPQQGQAQFVPFWTKSRKPTRSQEESRVIVDDLSHFATAFASLPA